MALYQLAQGLDHRRVVPTLRLVASNRSPQTKKSAGPSLPGPKGPAGIVDQLARALAARAFSDDILQDPMIQQQVAIHLLQAPVFGLQVLEPFEVGRLQPAVLGSPLIEGGAADVLDRQRLARHASPHR